jgi:pimeloyl-ACP methyl ester carboxylesterase
VLVGHSLGGLYATLYADRYPHDVAGIVLVEPSFAQQDEDAEASELANDARAFEENTSQLRKCAALARLGKLKSERHDECFVFAPNRTAAERGFLTFQMVRPFRYEAMASESESQHSADGRSDINSREEITARRKFGDRPVIVLTAAEAANAAATPAERDASARQWRSWKAGHDELARRSTQGKSVVVEGAGHFVQLDKPDAVIAAVREVLDDIRSVQPR